MLIFWKIKLLDGILLPFLGLRFIVTIKLKYSTASQIFKRLSSYAKQNPLYKALKEFGRITKTIFILKYYDDLNLRQEIEKQLNKISMFQFNI